MNKNHILTLTFICFSLKTFSNEKEPSQEIKSYAAIVALYEKAHDNFLQNLPHSKENRDAIVNFHTA